MIQSSIHVVVSIKTNIFIIIADPPSAELVARVRNLYHNQVPDVRILIPVLNGLTKKEVLDVLPKLFQHKPETVKKALNCLWGIQVIFSPFSYE